MAEDLSHYEYAAYHSILKALALSPATWVRRLCVVFRVWSITFLRALLALERTRFPGMEPRACDLMMREAYILALVLYSPACSERVRRPDAQGLTIEVFRAPEASARAGNRGNPYLSSDGAAHHG